MQEIGFQMYSDMLKEAVRALKAGELVGFMLDQNRPAGLGVFVDFFGRPASTTPSWKKSGKKGNTSKKNWNSANTSTTYPAWAS